METALCRFDHIKLSRNPEGSRGVEGVDFDAGDEDEDSSRFAFVDFEGALDPRCGENDDERVETSCLALDLYPLTLLALLFLSLAVMFL